MKKFGIVCLAALICFSLWACTKEEEPEQANPVEIVSVGEIKQDIVNGIELADVRLDGFKIILDPGHGDTNDGTYGVNTRRPEKEVNLEIGLKLRALLEDQGATVIMTRDSDAAIGGLPETADKLAKKDADMQMRQKIVKDSNADLFISIHQNEFEDPAAYGPQVFYHPNSNLGAWFAKCIQLAMNKELEIEKPRPVNSGDYIVLRPGDHPSVIVECGFFSNPEEEKLLQDDSYQNKLVGAIVDGAKLYVALNNVSPKSAQQAQATQQPVSDPDQIGMEVSGAVETSVPSAPATSVAPQKSEGEQ